VETYHKDNGWSGSQALHLYKTQNLGHMPFTRADKEQSAK